MPSLRVIREPPLPMYAPVVTLVLALTFLQDFSSLLAKGRVLLDRSQYGQAEELFARAVELEPGDPSARYYLGVALLSQGKFAEAARSLEQAYYLSAQPNVPVLYELGTAYLRMDRLQEAERILSLAVELAPEDAHLQLQLGWVHYLKAEGERAEARFRKAVELEPTGLSYYHLALAELTLGKMDQAVASCRRAIEKDPDFANAHVVLGKSLAQLGNFEEARGALRRALELDPGAAEAYHQLGLMALRSADLQEAARLFQAAVGRDPAHQAAWYNAALVFERLGRKDEARQARSRFEALAAKARRRGKSLSTASPRESDPVPKK